MTRATGRFSGAAETGMFASSTSPVVCEHFPQTATPNHYDAVQGFIEGIANLLVDAWWDSYSAAQTDGEEGSHG